MSDKPSHMHELRSQCRKEMRSEWERKLELLEDTDYQIEQILDIFAATNEFAWTFVFFVSDNDYMLGDIGLLGRGAHQESAGIPFVLRCPGRRPARA